MKHCLKVTLLLLLLATGCAGVLVGQVQKRAPFDLSCPAEEVEIIELGNRTYGAEGCGHKATYLVNCSEENGCVAILNSLDESVTDRSLP